jgi:hypothetical protein
MVVNMDQTGVHVVPAASWTYERIGSSAVAIVGADDKRQITACVAASLRGDLLPLQLIFDGKTQRSLPVASAASIAARIDITNSDNHWSSQETMQRYIEKVIVPHTERMITLYELRSDAHMILLLDAWAVHKSAQFRTWMKQHHPRIHLLYVPANCTSKLQLADVALQRPFKHGITERFNMWAAQKVAEQIRDEQLANIADLLKMSVLKPLILDWCAESWRDLRERKELILEGWKRSCTDLYDVLSPAKREAAHNFAYLREIDPEAVPEDTEADGYADSENFDSEDELDLTKIRQFGKQSGRARKQTKPHGYMLSSEHIEFEDPPASAAAAAASHRIVFSTKLK